MSNRKRSHTSRKSENVKRYTKSARSSKSRVSDRRSIKSLRSRKSLQSAVSKRDWFLKSDEEKILGYEKIVADNERLMQKLESYEVANVDLRKEIKRL